METDQVTSQKKEFPLLLTMELFLVGAVIWWLGTLVSKDYDPVKNMHISYGDVAENTVACVEAHPIQAIMATAWHNFSKWDFSFLGEQYFIMGRNGQIESVWSKDDTLKHLEDPSYNAGDSVCVVVAAKE